MCEKWAAVALRTHRSPFFVFFLPLYIRVGVGGFEPPTTASQTRCASQLRYTPEEGEYNADVACASSRRVRYNFFSCAKKLLTKVTMGKVGGFV